VEFRPESEEEEGEEEREGGSLEYRGVAYDEKSNLIICCLSNGIVYFYDATTLKQSRSPLRLAKLASVNGKAAYTMAFSPEADTVLFVSNDRCSYKYNLSQHILNDTPLASDDIERIALIHSNWFGYVKEDFGYRNDEDVGFSIMNLKKIGEDRFYTTKHYPSDLCNIERQRVCVWSYFHEYLSVHRTDQLPKLPVLCSRKVEIAHLFGRKVQSIALNKKEYIMTYHGKLIEILQMNKGKLNLVKVIQIEKIIDCILFLEECKAIVVACGCELQFIGVLSGKLLKKRTGESDQVLRIGCYDVANMFFIKDQNSIVATSCRNSMRIIKLY